MVELDTGIVLVIAAGANMGSKKCESGCNCGRHFKSEEHRRKLSEINSQAWTDEMRRTQGDRTLQAFQDPEVRQKHADGVRRVWSDPEVTKRRRETFLTTWTEHYGPTRTEQIVYRAVSGCQGHPLANSGGQIHEHRLVLWEKLGCESLDCAHYCHWNCGKLLVWGGHSGIIVDHIDENWLNNDPENLVPSCNFCNTRRKMQRTRRDTKLE